MMEEIAESAEDGVGDHLTPQEVGAIIRSWSGNDLLRVKLYAKKLVANKPIGCTEDDIVSEACERLLKGKRRARRGISFLGEFVQIMRSLVSNRLYGLEGEYYKLHMPLPSEDPSEERIVGLEILRQLQDRRTPEFNTMYQRACEELEEMFPDIKDREVYEMQYLWGQKAEAICQQLNMSRTEYETRMKRIQRRWRKRDE